MQLLEYQRQLYYAGKINVHSYISPISAKVTYTLTSHLYLQRYCTLLHFTYIC